MGQIFLEAVGALLCVGMVVTAGLAFMALWRAAFPERRR